MRKSFVLKAMAGLALTTAMSSAALAASTTVTGGQINFIGQVVDAPCTLSTASQNQTINLGQVKTTDLATDGAQQSNVKSVSFVLENCTKTAQTNAQFAFTGSTTGSTKTLANVDASGGAATNVGVFMKDQTGVDVTFDGTPTTARALQTSATGTNNTITMTAGMQAVGGAATAGAVAAMTNFNIIYS